MSVLLEPEVFRSVMEELQVGVYFTDRQRRIVFWNAGAERITGYLSQEVIGRCCRDDILLHCDHRQVVVCGSCCPVGEAIADGKAREASLFLRHKTGHRIPVRIHTLPIRDAHGTVIGAAECFQRQRYLPHPDRREAAPVSTQRVQGIPDYNAMLAEIRLRLAHIPEDTEEAFGVLAIEVDHFDELRLNRGQEACEAVLHVLANTFQNTIRPEDCLGSGMAGQLLLVTDCANADSVGRAGERLRALASCSCVVWWGDRVPVSVSLGGTLARAGDSVESVMQRMDRALEVSAAQGGNCVTVAKES